MEVPGYKVRRTIGQGGMATVYLALQESLNREVVLKTVNTTHSNDSDFLERFVNEGRMVASLTHPNIITIHDIGSANELVYISMEYVQGGDLKAKITGRCDPAETLDLIRKIGAALGFGHDHGIIHRDVKPANILFRSDGTVLLSDFGIAKQIEADSELTSTGTILGSPFYMSPEQAEGMVVDGRTDIYSLGVIFYEMLTGERPYQGDSAIKVIMQHIQSPLPTLPEDLSRFQPMLTKMMHKDRDQRFVNAAELVAYIDNLLVPKPAVHSATDAGERHRTDTASPITVPWSKATPRRDKRRLLIAFLIVCLVSMALSMYGLRVYTTSLRSPIIGPQHDLSAQQEAELNSPARLTGPQRVI